MSWLPIGLVVFFSCIFFFGSAVLPLACSCLTFDLRSGGSATFSWYERLSGREKTSGAFPFDMKQLIKFFFRPRTYPIPGITGQALIYGIILVGHRHCTYAPLHWHSKTSTSKSRQSPGRLICGTFVNVGYVMCRTEICHMCSGRLDLFKPSVQMQSERPSK